MISQFIQLLVSMLVDVIGEMIDRGFTNSLGINEICIFGIACSVHGLCYTVSRYGTYVFRITGKNGKECLAVSSIISIALGAILFITAPYISIIWYIEPSLEKYLILAIRCQAFCELPRALGVFFTNYLQYTGKNNLCTKLLVLFYVWMFVFDTVGVFVFKSLPIVILGTGASNAIYSLVAYYTSGLNKEKFNARNIKWVFQTGFGYFSERIFSRASRTLYEIGAT